MTEIRWKKIEEYVCINGDSIKDVVDEGELIDYILELRKKLNLPSYTGY